MRVGTYEGVKALGLSVETLSDAFPKARFGNKNIIICKN